MKYLKLFENFGGEDPKWIVTSALDPIEVDEVTFDEKYGDTSMFRLFDLGDRPSKYKLNNLKSWLKKEGYYCTINFNKVIVTEKTFKDSCIDWLNTNYSGMESVDSKDRPGNVLYRYEPKNNILVYYKKAGHVSSGYVWVSYNLIWSFFDYFVIDNQKITSITEEWLSKTYDLKGTTPIHGMTITGFE